MKTLVGGQMPRIRSDQSRRFGWGLLFFQNRRGWNNNDPYLRNINGGIGLGEGAAAWGFGRHVDMPNNRNDADKIISLEETVRGSPECA